MSKRITLNSRVSTEAWRFDSRVTEDQHRWSFKVFGERWRDARVFGSVIKLGSKVLVRWDIDGEESSFETSVLYKEENESKISSAGNKYFYSGFYSGRIF